MDWYLISFIFFFWDFFLMWTIFKVFTEFVTILLLFYVLVFWLWGMWDPSSLTRDRTCTPCTGRQSLTHWFTREVPGTSVLYFSHLASQMLSDLRWVWENGEAAAQWPEASGSALGILIPAWPVTGCVTLGKSFHLLGIPVPPHLFSQDKNCSSSSLRFTES